LNTQKWKKFTRKMRKNANKHQKCKNGFSKKGRITETTGRVCMGDFGGPSRVAACVDAASD
jgi:hypothetical protein